MLEFLQYLRDAGPGLAVFNVFGFPSFRAGGAVLTALLVCLLTGRHIINWLVAQGAQPIRSDGPKNHSVKSGTPTMGGFMILFAIFVSVLLWGRLSNPYIWVLLFVTGGYGLVGFADDWQKIRHASSRGLSGRTRVIIEFVIALVAVAWISQLDTTETRYHLAFPFFKDFTLNLGYFFIPLGALVILGMGNSVNFTDGLDGLAIVPIMIAAGSFAVIGYIVGTEIRADELLLHHIPQAQELAIFGGAIVGASLGFLWFNAPPAMVFMGDTGSLSAGAALGTMAVIAKHEIVLGIIGGLFVLETLSVIIQVISFKLTGRRVFLMAPIHHHFEKLGWQEPTIVIRFWIIAFVLALLGLSTLKLR